MAGVFSDIDFNRMQEQLLELRESLYKSDEKCKRQAKELVNLKEQLAFSEKELIKANQVISKSKKSKEFESALNEMDLLQRKLQNHEEDSRLQNETLLKELAQLVGANERLEKELMTLREEKGDDVVSREDYVALQDELRRLQAQYSAVMKCNRTLPDGAPTPNENQELTNRSNGEDMPCCQDDQKDNEDHVDQLEPAEVTQQEQNIEYLKLTLAIEKEENVLLKRQLNNLEMKHKEEVSGLKQEVEKLSEKLKKKQESLLQLQEAKDQLFNEMSDKLIAAQTEQRKLLDESQNKYTREFKSWLSNKKSLEDKLNELKKRFSEVDNDRKELEARTAITEQENLKSFRDLQLDFEMKMKKQSEILTNQKETIVNLKAQVEESRLTCQRAASDVMEMKKDREIQVVNYQEASKLAEKRKTLLDQLAVKYQEDSDQHREQLREQQHKHEAVINKLDLELSQLKVQLKELKSVESECDSLRDQLRNVESAKNFLERSLRDVEKELAETREKSEFDVTKQSEDHANEVAQLHDDHTIKLQELEDTIQRKDLEIESSKQLVTKYEQIIKDHSEDKKLHEKKGSTVIKDLRKQLHSERKRAEKLQERLQEILSDPKNRPSLDDSFRPMDDRLKFADNSSLSSWSPSGLSRDNVLSQGTDEESDSTLRQENDELIRRTAELMQKVSMMEEKVSHLESSNAAMAEDILEKTAVIDYYHMDAKPVATHSNNDKSSFKRVMEFVTEKSDDRKEMNKKLQRVMEETLTKNMHLQNDLERLTKELSELKNEQPKPL